MISVDPRQQFEELKTFLIGAEGIVRDRPVIARVRLGDVAGDDRGITIQVEAIQASGFVKLPSDKCSLFSVWEGSSVSKRHILGAPYCTWSLYLDTELTVALSEFASSLGDAIGARDSDALSRYLSLSHFIAEYEEPDVPQE